MTTRPNHDPIGARERAEELQMHACLEELGGAAPADDLIQRILTAASGSTRAHSVGKKHYLLAALLVLGGLAVVGSIAWLRHGAGDSTPAADVHDQNQIQDPTPAKPEKQRVRTLIADYSQNEVFEVDANGRVVWRLAKVFGAWDAQPLANGNVLVTEFSTSRVREVNRKGKDVWTFDDLKNPYCAQRLGNGNTLIADTFAGRVIEVDPQKQIVWQFDRDIRPFDAEMTLDATVLIADVLADRVIEVDHAGKIIWQVGKLPNCHDADRLPNGNTLVTLRTLGCVREITPKGKVVREIKDLAAPSDADLLPNGHILVAENSQVREFDRNGKQVWKHATTWAVEANRTYR